MEDKNKFPLVSKKSGTNSRCDEQPTIRIKAEAYEAVLEMCGETGESLCVLASRAIMYAYKNRVIIDE